MWTATADSKRVVQDRLRQLPAPLPPPARRLRSGAAFAVVAISRAARGRFPRSPGRAQPAPPAGEDRQVRFPDLLEDRGITFVRRSNVDAVQGNARGGVSEAWGTRVLQPPNKLRTK